VENGSLANIIKPNKFGPFPESLVAVYIAQVLVVVTAILVLFSFLLISSDFSFYVTRCWKVLFICMNKVSFIEISRAQIY
jgi:hypothetical protein